MNELNETGFMHNRMRMVVSILTKDLFIDWAKIILEKINRL